MENQIMTMEMVNDGQRITSLEIAELTGKAHRNVLRDIRNMEPAWEKVHQLKFEQMQIQEKLPNNGYRLKKVYSLTKLESLYVFTRYDDEARAKLVGRWAELERKSLAKEMREVKLLETKEEILKRSDAIFRQEIAEENEPACDCFTNTEIADMLRVDRKWMIAMLKREHVIIRVAGRYELQPPYDRKGYEMYRHYQGYGLKGDRKKDEYMVWTPKGRDFVIELIEKIKDQQEYYNY